jgi:hypothetical protein
MPHLNERQLRLAAALEERSLGYGGVSAVAQATGIARGKTCVREEKEKKQKNTLDSYRPSDGRT